MGERAVAAPGLFRFAILALAALAPSRVTVFLYRHLFGYRIGSGVRIGISIVHAAECEIGANTIIGHGNLILRVRRIVIGDHVRIGDLNMIRGGDEVRLGRYAVLLRWNQLNSIPDADIIDGQAEARLLVGAGTVITTGHKIDFTDRVELGRRVILGGRSSSIWTHNRQRTAPVLVGDLVYLGSEIRMAPGSTVPARSIVGMGAVVTDHLRDEGWLYGGVPARPIKPLDEHDRPLVERRTRPDLPDDV